MPSFRPVLAAGVLAALAAAAQIQSQRANAQLTPPPIQSLGGPVSGLPEAPNQQKVKPLVPAPPAIKPLTAATRVPVSTPIPTPVPVLGPRFPGLKVIRVGLSTAGAGIAIYTPDGGTIFDLDQPGLSLKVKAGARFQFGFGPVRTNKVSGKIFRGPITFISGNTSNIGWQHPYLAVDGASARITTNGTSPRYGHPYRGDLEIFPQLLPEPVKRKGPLALVNVVPIEAYLKGVVPWEMGDSGPMEALKAQAICARTKTLQFEASGKFARGKFDICDYDACQGYPGTENEKPATSAAVDATAGLALFKNGHPIDAVYSTNSGGITAAARDVWKATTPITYLQSVIDFPPNSPMAQLFKGGMNEAKWAQFCSQNWPSYARPTGISSDRYEARKYRWTDYISVADAKKAFEGRGFDTITGFEVVQRADSGRIRQLRVVGTSKGSPVLAPGAEPGKEIQATKFITIEGDGKIRAMFSGRLGSTTALPSSLFVILPRVDAAGILLGWDLNGAGWGHGVGMCQRGAQNHAKEGWDARRILKWYYHDIEIRKTS